MNSNRSKIWCLAWWNASVSHNETDCLCFNSHCTNLTGQSTIVLRSLQFSVIHTLPLFPNATLATSSTFLIFPWQYLLLLMIKNAPCVEAINTHSKITDVKINPPCWNANGNDRIPPPTIVDTRVNIDEKTVPVLSWSSLRWITWITSGVDSVTTAFSAVFSSSTCELSSLEI